MMRVRLKAENVGRVTISAPTGGVMLGAWTPPELAERVRHACAELERPVSWVVRKALVAWLEKHEGGQDAPRR